ncbi:MAG: HAD-IC family P-type ATPase [bacterium]
MAEIFWHNLAREEVIKILGSDIEKGLTEKEVALRQEKFGDNKLTEEKPLSQLRIFLEQLRSPLIYILIIAGLITLVLREFADSIVIFGAVILNTVVGYFQENKASKALQELKKVVKQETQVLREGREKIIDSLKLIPGDIFILNPGNKVPSDARILESHNLKINEMALTGEWLPASKIVDLVSKETPLADRDNMVYMGTVVEEGKGRAVVTETGSKTEIGKVAIMVKETSEEKTPLQRKLAQFSKVIGLVVAFVAFLVFVEGIITGNTFLEMFTTSVAVVVAAIPEGLPVALTVILALSMQRILKRKGLVRRLLAAETLGSTSVIATDKTLTLTEGKMEVTEVFAPDKKNNQDLALKIAALANEAFIENPEDPSDQWRVQGRPTEKALLTAASLAGFSREELEKKEEEIYQAPFDPVKKYGAVLYKTSKNSFYIYSLGAPEKLLELSKIGSGKLKKFNQKLQELTEKGYRVMGAAYGKARKPKSEIRNLEEYCRNLTFVGLIALRDPLRKDVKEAMKVCIRAGMRPIIVTGDHKLTAKAVALELGFKIEEKNIIEGKDLEQMSDRDFEGRLKDIIVYSRVEPKDKLRIIKAWQKMGEVVAMTGDGINDAPALKKADIGIALGSGTEVAKETSDLILLNDSFSIILAAVEEGRAVLDNIRKVITYLLSDSFSEVILIGGALLAGFPLPILPAQILWVNLVEDGLPDFALAFEPKEKDLMKQSPKKRNEPLLTKEMKTIIFVIGIATDLILLGLFFWLWKQNYDIFYIRTMIFGGLAINSLFYVFSCKSLRRNIWHINIFSNKLLLLAVGVGFLMLFSAIYLPPLQTLLKTVSLGFSDWLILFGLGMANIIFIEATKWYFIVNKKI